MILYCYLMIAVGVMYLHLSKQERTMLSVNDTIKKAHCQARCGANEDCLSSLNNLAYTDGMRNCSTECKEIDGCWSSVCRCIREQNNLLEFNHSSWTPDSEGLELICHTESRLHIQWPISDVSNISYVIALFDLLYEVLLDVHIGYSPVSYDNLLADKQYKLHVVAVGDDGIVSFYSEIFRTLPENFQPEDVSAIDIETFIPNDNNVDAIIHWIPAADRTCNYELIWWDELDCINTEDVEITTNMFKHTLKNLGFGLKYSVEISGKDSNWYKESNKTGVMFNTPTCLEIHKNKSSCVTFASMNLTVQDVSVGYGLFDLHVTWEQLDLKPDSYIFLFSGLTENGTALNKSLVAPTDAHEVYLRGVELSDWYSVRAKALYGENESPESVSMHYTSRLIDDPAERSLSTLLNAILWISGITVTLFFAMAIAIIRYRRHRAELFAKSVKSRETVQQIIEYPDDKLDPCGNYLDPLEIDISRLLLLEKLGQGAFGVVRKALLTHNDGTPNRLVAIKMLNSNPCLDDIRNFQEEIEVMRKVGTHPYIVSLLGCSSNSSEKTFFISEYCAKGDLQNYLRTVWENLISKTSHPFERVYMQNTSEFTTNVAFFNSRFSANDTSDANSVSSTNKISISAISTNSVNDGKFNISTKEDIQYISTSKENTSNCVQNRAYGLISTEKESTITIIDLLNYGRQIAVGMEYLSSNKVVHRDLAARNILVCEDGSVKIADFGLSRDIYQQNIYKKTGNGKLPIKWLALESLTRQIYTTQSDVWSFGILMWEIITLGAAPYPTIPARKLIQVLQSGIRMERPENCSQELYAILLSCWKARPYDRPTFRQLKENIEELISRYSTQPYLTLDSGGYERPYSATEL